MKNKIFILLVLTSMIVSCKKEESELTKATITVKDESGNVVIGMPIYAFKENTWR